MTIITLDDPSPAPDDAPLPPWAAALSVGAIASFRWPARGQGRGGRRSPPSPCLVVDTETLGDVPVVVLAQGVPAVGRAARGTDLYATTEDLKNVDGLPAPHVFLVSRRLMVTAGSGGFVVDPDRGSPGLGRLQGRALRRLHALRARFHAEHDIAAEQRRERQRRRREGAVPGRDFAVEQRRAAPPVAHRAAHHRG